MNQRSTRVRAAIGGLVLATGAAGLAIGLIGPASSAVSVPWTDTDAVGTITLYDANGAVVTSGSTRDPLPAYAVGSTLPRGGDSVGALYAYTPTKSGGDWSEPGTWSGAQLSAASAFPTTGPAAVTGGKPAAVTGTGATTLAQYIAAYPNTSGDSALGAAYELRLRTSAPGSVSGFAYDTVDVVVSGDTWTVASQASGGSQATATHTTLGASSTSVASGASVTLTATLDPAAAQGTVQFADGGTPLGGPVTVVGGVASKSVVPTAGQHSYTAAFDPTNLAAYGASTSAAVTVTASAPSTGGGSTTPIGSGGTGGGAVATPASVSSIKAAKVKASAKKLTLAVTSVGAVSVKVKVYDGKKLLGTATIAGGKLTLRLKKKLAKGKHTLKVKYAGSATVAAFTKTVKVTVK